MRDVVLRTLAPGGSDGVRRQQFSKTLQATMLDVLHILLAGDWDQRTMVCQELLVLHALEVHRALVRRPRQRQQLDFNRSVARFRVAQEAGASLATPLSSVFVLSLSYLLYELCVFVACVIFCLCCVYLMYSLYMLRMC